MAFLLFFNFQHWQMAGATETSKAKAAVSKTERGYAVPILE
jgi:hypothetical protein